MEWQLIETAPKDGTEIIVWYSHEADPYIDPNDSNKLTDYGANAEGGEFLAGEGLAIAKWVYPEFESTDEYGSGFWRPGGWFVRDPQLSFEAVCNPVFWQPAPEPPA